MTKLAVTSAKLREWLGIPPTWHVSVGIPLGATLPGEEDIVLVVTVENPGGATAGEAKPPTCLHGRPTTWDRQCDCEKGGG